MDIVAIPAYFFVSLFFFFKGIPIVAKGYAYQSYLLLHLPLKDEICAYLLTFIYSLLLYRKLNEKIFKL